MARRNPDLRLPGKTKALIYELTDDDKRKFLEELSISHLHSADVASQCGFTLDSLNYAVQVEKDKAFNEGWNKILRGRTVSGLSRTKVFNSLVQKGDLQQQLVDAGINDKAKEFVESIDLSTPKGRQEFLKFFPIYVGMFPKESAQDVLMRKEVTIDDLRNKKPLELQAMVREVQVEIGGILEDKSKADNERRKIAESTAKTEEEFIEQR